METNQESIFCSSAIQARSSSNVALKHIKAMQNCKKKQAYMPFLFKNKKQSNKNISASPAPGHYTCKSSFQQKDSRDLLKQKYDLQMENTKKIKQNVMFKSTAKRFNYKQEIDQTPISYSYRYHLKSKAFCRSSKSGSGQINYRNQISKHKSLINIEDRSLCPSIPNSANKFGYLLNGEGKLKKIDKTNTEIENQRQQMKKYVQSLSQQNKLNINLFSFSSQQRKQKKAFVHNLRKKLQQLQQSQSLNISNMQKLEKNEKVKKPLHQFSSSHNKAKLAKIFQQKKIFKQSLGPGFYDMSSYSSLGQNYKPEKYQFFSSTSARFSSVINGESKQSSRNLMKKIQIQNKLLESKKQKIVNLRKGLKKPERQNQRCFSTQKNSFANPGPGDYNLAEAVAKNKSSKVSSFNKSQRFNSGKQNKENRPKISNNPKLLSHLNSIIIQENHRIPKYNFEVIQKNKQILRNKKQLIEQSFKKYITRGQSEYSLCSWDSRPFSRNEALPTLFKEQAKNQN